MKASSIRIILLTMAGTTVLGLYALRVEQPGSKDTTCSIPVEVVNQKGLLNKLFNIQPSPLKNCSEVAEWMKEHPNAFQSVVQRSEFEAVLQYRPAPCMACLEMSDADLTDDAFVERIGQLENSEQYVLRLHPSNRNSILPQVDGLWQPRVVEIIGLDTIPCAFLHVETMPPGVPFSSVVLGFERLQDDEDRQVLISDLDGTLQGDLLFTLPKGGPSALLGALNPTSQRQ